MTGVPDGVRRLAVLGSPIAHSRSPQLHEAAYGVLGLPWEYGRVEMTGDGLAGFVAGLDASWRGLSLTMPLKVDVLPLLAERTDLVAATGAANTVLFDGAGPRGFNTDVAGVVGALAEHGVTGPRRVHVVGTGATAGSVLAAVAALGAADVVVSGRTPEGLADTVALAGRLGLAATSRRYGEPMPWRPDLVAAALPGGVDPDDIPAADDGDALLEVPYAPWPTPRAARWAARGAPVATGLEMLLHQAVEQVRIFVTGAEGGALEREAEVIAAMRGIVGLGDPVLGPDGRPAPGVGGS